MPKSMQPKAENITSPKQLAVNEQLRDAAILDKDSLQGLPTDVFVFNYGETSQRAITRVGGLPYRSVQKPWPCNPMGQPLTFVGQFCFVDSCDIVGPLPGDVLLIFADADRYGYDWGDEDRLPLVFEWVSLNESDLITADSIPQTAWQITPCFGSIYRTSDYLELDEYAYPQVADFIPFSHPATKIGGVPTWIQDEEELSGRLLCQITSIGPVIDELYPYLNVPYPITFTEWYYNHPLLWGDMGTLYLFLDQGNTIHWIIQAN